LVAAKNIMPASLRKLVVDVFTCGFETNSAEKVSLLVTGNGDQPHIVNLMTQYVTPNGDATHIGGAMVTGRPAAQVSGEKIQGPYSLLYQQQRHVEELKRDQKERTEGISVEALYEIVHKGGT
jgi:hypothetical protein